MTLDPLHFDRIAELYDRARPPYPPELAEHLLARGVLAPGMRVLELGAGTGQATGILLDSGADVVAVEPGGALAGILRGRYPGLDVRQQTAETLEVSPGSFDAVAVATAVHWLDLDAVLPKLHRALVPGGRLAVWRNVYGDPDVPVTPFRERVAEIVRRRAAPPRPGPGESDGEGWMRRLESGGLFGAVDRRTFRWTIDLDAGAVRDLFTTFSDWTPVEADGAARAVDDLGGTVTENYTTPVLILSRVP